VTRTHPDSINLLLLAGPCGFDGRPGCEHLLSGPGLLAAASAAASVPVQLWSRAGSDFDDHHRQVLRQATIDCAGIDDQGMSPRWYGQDPASGPALPEFEPTDAEGVGAAAAIGLNGDESARALRAFAALPDADGRPLLLAPDTTVDGDWLRAHASQATCLVLGLDHAQQALGDNDPLSCGQALLEAGAKSVLLSAGPLGGIALYKGKIVPWLTRPEHLDAPSGWARAAFAGVVAATLARLGRIDLRNLKRALATASAVAAACCHGHGSKAALAMSHGDQQGHFLRLRRNAKF
jgi:hypothetical protein